MAATAPRTTKPVAATRPTRGSTRAVGSVASPRPKTPTTDVVKDTAGPAVKLGNAAAAKDPRFQKVMVKLQKSAAQTKQHPSPQRKAAEAQAAARPPANEKLAGAQANQVDTMQSAEGKKPEKSSFLDLLRAEIAKIMPQTLGDTEDFMEGDQPQQLKGAMTGNINQQKEEASGAIKAASKQPPDPSKIEGKAVTPLPTEGVPPAPPAVGAKEAIPLPKPEREVSLEKSKKDADQQLKDAKLTPRQLQKANDPRFSAVLTAKSTVEKQAGSAPKQFRTEEQRTLTQETARAVAHEKQGLTAFQREKGKAGPAVKQKQLDAQQKNEARRKEVTDTIEKIYNETKQAVEARLASLEKDVSSMFDKGIEAAMTKMKSEIDRKMHAYKKERYSGWTGKAAWAKDKLFGMPDEVNVFYKDGHTQFTQDLDALVVEIAATVETRLKEAKDEITKGQKRIQDYVQCLPEDLQAVGKAAEKEMESRFEELQQRVDEKKNDLAQSLAQQYKDASDKANEQLKKMQEENKGLVNKLIDAVGEVVKILLEFKDRIMDMLKQSVSIILSIVADPIGFLKNLLNAIAQGLKQFIGKIGTHLKEGFMAWLVGSLAITGIEMPKEFSAGSMLKLVLQVLGLTYDRIRAKAVTLVGEKTVKVLETAGRLLITFVTGGPMALWEMIKEYLPNLMETVRDKIQDWVITTIITVGIPMLAAMFTPVGAIIQAIRTIYNAVMFFIERRNQILDFVQSIINSVKKIVDGDISGAAQAIEDALAKAIPLIIDFFARLLKLGGIASTIRGIIREIRHDVDKAVDLVIAKIAGGIGKLVGKGKEAVGKLVGWWKAKKQFRGKDGEEHTLYFSGEGDSAELMIASRAKSYERFIARIVVKDQPEDIKFAKSEALRWAKEIDALKKRKAKKEGGIQEEDMITYLNQLAIQTEILTGALGAVEAPPSIITYGDLTEDGGGTSMNAEILSKNTTKGSPPRDIPIIWQKAKRRKDTYVRGHLLNENLGGPGRAYNLTPITIQANNEHKEKVENKLKEMIKNGEVVYYHVTVEYGRKDSQKKQGKTTKKEKLEEAKEYEQNYLAKHLTIEWGILEYKGGKWVPKKKLPTPDPIRSKPPTDDNIQV